MTPLEDYMTVYLYVLDDRPRLGTDLNIIQGALEEDLLDKKHGASEVWWDELSPYEARVYLYGSKHADFGADPEDPYGEVSFETTDQLIWPVEDAPVKTEPEQHLDPLLPGGVEMTLQVKTETGVESFTRRCSTGEWKAYRGGRMGLLKIFAEDAVQAVGAHWNLRNLVKGRQT